MRELLSSLPDPGPMPADLVARITAALEHERGRSAAPADDARAAVIHRRWRRPGRRSMALAAAAAAVVLLSVPLATGRSSGIVSALFGRGDSGTSSSAAKALESAQGAPSDSRQNATEGEGVVVVYATGAEYTTAHLVGQARALLASGYAAMDSTAAAEASGPLGTTAGVRACAAGLGVLSSEPITADLARFDGAPAAILVVGRQPGATAYVVPRSCSRAERIPLAEVPL
jgi:hypothetical protein